MVCRYFFAAIVLVSTPLHARELVFPVITGLAGERALSTTVEAKNPGDSDATCTFTYRGPERVGRPLVSKETVPAGKTNVYEDFLSEIAAAGSVAVDCSDGVEIFVRAQDAEKVGATFSAGRLYRPFEAGNALETGGQRTVKTRSDLALVEVGGEPVVVKVAVLKDGGVIAETSYAMPPHGQRVVNLRRILDQVPEVDVRLTLGSGNGKIAIGKEIRDPALAKVALRRERGSRVVQAASQTAESSPSAMLGTCAFKGAPFYEPMTGLCFMRDRWYDPKTGTFLTPDKAGYRDSPNLYAYGAGDPVNNSDPTGMYIDESRILNSPLKNRYIGWRDRYLRSPLGQQIWQQLDAIPASVFTLEIGPMATSANGRYTAGAETSNFFDMTGVQNRAVIEFSPDFGDDPGSGAPLTTYYRHGIDIYANDGGAYIEYAFGHEIGHVLGGWDSTMAQTTRQFGVLGAQVNATVPQFTTLFRTQNRTPAQQQQFAQLTQLRNTLLQQQLTMKNSLEPYADDIGYQIYRSFRQAHPRWFGVAPVGGRNFNPPPQLPPSATANIPAARTP